MAIFMLSIIALPVTINPIMTFLKRISLTVLILCMALPSYACRFWAGVGVNISQDVVHQLLDQPQSLKVLGKEYQDGWSVGYYNDQQPVVWRSALASSIDQQFDEAVVSTSLQSSNIAFAHLRRASSGCVANVPNPHPFKIVKNGKTWLFGHNGGMKKQILIDLIGDDYLAANPPVVCTENPPETWIDSELFFIYLMKSIEEHAGNIEHGIAHGLLHLYEVIAEENRYLNFFLADGQTVWAFRKGTSLYYRYDDLTKRSFVSSTIPQAEQGDWREFPENEIAILKPNTEIQFISIKSELSNRLVH